MTKLLDDTSSLSKAQNYRQCQNLAVYQFPATMRQRRHNCSDTTILNENRKLQALERVSQSIGCWFTDVVD